MQTQQTERHFKDELPIVDISLDTYRQTVIAEGDPELYQGHPTTALSADGSTIFCVWTRNHGGPCGPMAKSTDGGRTWTRMDSILPASYARTHKNCPTLQTIFTPDGSEQRFCIFSCKNRKLGIIMSRDDGESWYELPPANLTSFMPPTGIIRLKDGSSAIFGQARTNPEVMTDYPTDDQDIWMSVTQDGGFSWSAPRTVAHAQEKNLCEPCVLRSPDGRELCMLMRENRHKGRSMMCFSDDEGQTWTTPEDTSWSLTGDRHEAIGLADGRLLIAFRDRAIDSSTYGQFVAWVGTYEDIRKGRPGQYRIHLLKHWPTPPDPPEHICADTGYSGVELLPDNTILCTTYTHHWPDRRRHSVVCTRFTIAETDQIAATLNAVQPN